MLRTPTSRLRSTLALAIILASGCRRSSPPSPPPPAPAPPAAPAATPRAESARADGGAAPVACPPEMAPVPGFGCIDRYEASADVPPSDGGITSGLGEKDGTGTTVVARSRAGVYPISNVTVPQARRACENAGKHLCREQEWVAACQGPEHWQYPYGNTFEPKRCNDWNVLPYRSHHIARTGEFPRCVTPSGIYDMANNVGEWMADPSHVPSVHEVRGGTYHMTVHDSSCEEDDYTVKPDSQQLDIGFRCCR